MKILYANNIKCNKLLIFFEGGWQINYQEPPLSIKIRMSVMSTQKTPTKSTLTPNEFYSKPILKFCDLVYFMVLQIPYT